MGNALKEKGEVEEITHGLRKCPLCNQWFSKDKMAAKMLNNNVYWICEEDYKLLPLFVPIKEE